MLFRRQPSHACGRGAGAIPRHVLIVANQPLVLKIIEQLVVALGHRPLLARSGSDALSIANQTGPVDVALIDVFPGDLPGPDLADELRRLYPAIRVVYMSGDVDSIYLESRVGSADWLKKPFTLDELRAKLGDQPIQKAR